MKLTVSIPKVDADAVKHGALLFGAAAISIGFYLAWRPLGFIVAGAFAVVLALIIDRAQEQEQRGRG